VDGPEPGAGVGAVVEVDEPVLLPAAVEPIRKIQTGHFSLTKLLKLSLNILVTMFKKQLFSKNSK